MNIRPGRTIGGSVLLALSFVATAVGQPRPGGPLCGNKNVVPDADLKQWPVVRDIGAPSLHTGLQVITRARRSTERRPASCGETVLGREHDLLEELEPFQIQLRCEQADAGGVAGRAGEAGECGQSLVAPFGEPPVDLDRLAFEISGVAQRLGSLGASCPTIVASSEDAKAAISGRFRRVFVGRTRTRRRLLRAGRS